MMMFKTLSTLTVAVAFTTMASAGDYGRINNNRALSGASYSSGFGQSAGLFSLQIGSGSTRLGYTNNYRKAPVKTPVQQNYNNFSRPRTPYSVAPYSNQRSRVGTSNRFQNYSPSTRSNFSRSNFSRSNYSSRTPYSRGLNYRSR